MIVSVIAGVAVGAYVGAYAQRWALKKNLTTEVQNFEAEFSALRTKVTSAGVVGVVIVEKDFDALLAVGKALAAKL
jgi:hypothetical protein